MPTKRKIEFWHLGVRVEDIICGMKNLLTDRDRKAVLKAAARRAMKRNRVEHVRNQKLRLFGGSASHRD